MAARMVQTLTLGRKRFVVIPEAEYKRLTSSETGGDGGGVELLPLPKADAEGNLPAVEYARASLARKIIKARRAAGLSQAELARRAGVRPETLNRIEKGRNTPDTATIAKISRVLEKASP
jgi:DNA-binding XRE family transcriptional regulator